MGGSDVLPNVANKVEGLFTSAPGTVSSLISPYRTTGLYNVCATQTRLMIKECNLDSYNTCAAKLTYVLWLRVHCYC